MEMWSIMQVPNGDYCLWLCNSKMPGEKTIVIDLKKEDAEEIIKKTGCKTEEIPF